MKIDYPVKSCGALAWSSSRDGKTKCPAALKFYAYDKADPKLHIIGDDHKTCCINKSATSTTKIDYPVKSCGATDWGSDRLGKTKCATLATQKMYAYDRADPKLFIIGDDAKTCCKSTVDKTNPTNPAGTDCKLNELYTPFFKG
jgi:hypothetical protein